MKAFIAKKWFFLVILSALMGGILALPAEATTIKKNISKDSVWTAGKSPYVVKENITLEEGVTLEIEPGAKIEIDPEKTIEIRGRFLAKGTKEKPIIFTAHKDEPWGTLYFTDFSDDATFAEDDSYLDGCIMRNCIIEKGGGIYVRYGAPLITDCTIHDNVSSGIRVEFGAPRIVRNHITGNSTKEDPASGNGGGIIAYTDKSVLIADNIINDNISDGGRDGGGGVHAYAIDDGKIVVRDNLIYGNTCSRFGGGIYAYNALLTGNKVIGNSTAERGGGIYAVDSQVSGNLVQSNSAERGGGIYAEDGDILSNSVIGNTSLRPDGGALYYFGSGDVLRNCFASNTAQGENNCGGIYVSGNPRIHENNLLNNSGYALYVGNVADSPLVSAGENYWGAISEKAILKLTYDWLDDDTVGLAECIPFLKEISSGSPPPPPVNLMAIATEEGIRLNWENASSFTCEDHKIHIATKSGYPYERTIEAGPEKSFVIRDLKPETEYLLAVSGCGQSEGKRIETGISEEVRILFTPSEEAINQPKNVSPKDAESGVTGNTTLNVRVSRARGRVVESRWQISVFQNDFTSPVSDLTAEGEELFALNLDRADILNGQKYFWRFACRTAGGSWSDWSVPTSFSTVADSPSLLSGPISSMKTLEKQFSPYHVEGNTLIMPGATLLIEPGVKLRVAAGKNLLVRGKLVARGTIGEPVIVTRKSPEKWGQIIFDDVSLDADLNDNGDYVGGSILERCTLEHGKGLLVKSASPLIKDCEISYHDGSGITVRQGGPVITGNDIHHNAARTNGGGIYAYTNDIIRITSNEIHDNRANGEGGGVFAYGYMNTSAIRVEDNDIYSNEATGDGAGIYLSRSSAVGNRIKLNRAEGDGGGIYATFGLINGNDVRENHAVKGGGGIYAERNSSVIENYVTSNRALSGFGGGVYINFWGISIENEVFTGNTVTENLAPSGERNGGVYIVGHLVFAQNNINGNIGSQLYNGNTSDSPSLSASECYWGATEADAIAKLIVDGQDDPALGNVDFEPFASEPIKFD